MKLRNKKTGDAVYVDFQIPLSNNNDALGYYSVTSLKKLNESFEDYMPTEPLIKDEKIRKAVRAWAEACGADDADIVRHYGAERWIGLRYENPNTGWVSKFEIDGFGSCNQLGNGKVYTIAELCGEEEE